MQSAKRMGVPAIVVKELVEADALVTLRAYYRGRQQTILEAEQRGMPIYVLRANTNNQIEQLLADIFNLTLGAAYAAGLAVGYWSTQEDLRKNWGVDHTWQPGMDAGKRQVLYNGWKKAVTRTFNWVDSSQTA